MSVISDNLKKARKALGWSQEQAAAQLGIKRSNLASYEEGRAFPSITLLPALVVAYGILDWQRFIEDPAFDLHNQVAPAPPISLVEHRFNLLDKKQKNLAKQLLNLP